MCIHRANESIDTTLPVKRMEDKSTGIIANHQYG